MSEIQSDHQYLVSALRQYVSAPLSTASRRVKREQTELTAERDAFKAFDERLQSISPEAPLPKQHPVASVPRHEQQVEKMDRLRTAYEETVMDVPHYERVYGEPLVEHVEREFHPGFVDRFTTTTVPFTAEYKHALRQRVRQAIKRRENTLEIIAKESQSITDARTTLKDISMPLQTTIIPEWHAESFTAQLDEVAEKRQVFLRTRDAINHINAHSLCAYLYADESWTYPVLTATARMRETVSLKPSQSKVPETDA